MQTIGEGQAVYQYDPVTGQYKLVASKAKTYAPKTTGGATGGTGTGGVSSGATPSYRTEKALNVISQIDEALNMISPYTTGVLGTVAGFIPGTPAKDLQKAVETIKANIGFSELQAMREASKTGGALGQVAVQELNALQSILGSLDTTQSPEALYKNLQDIRDRYSNILRLTNQGVGRNTDIITAPDGTQIQIID